MKVNTKLRHIFCGLLVSTFVVADVIADAPAPRSAVSSGQARAVGTTPRTAKQPTVNPRKGATVTTRSVSVRKADQTSENTKQTNRSRAGVLTRAGNTISNIGNTIIYRAFGLTRNEQKPLSARVAKKTGATYARTAAVSKGASRARATAVFSDISKLGDGYNNCRQAYNTCMDQFCAGANETYRRCFCSNTFRSLRDKEDALDAATQMLAKFEDNNLNAVNKTAEEVNAMYSATAGEAAIKNDTSGAAALLNDIGDLLSGKRKPEPNQNMTSLTGLSVNFSSDMGDIWGSGSDSLFGDDSAQDLSALEGTDLYNNAHTQCMQLIGETCENGAVKNMTKSAYNILITQDCNAYQKKLDQKTEQVKSTVRTAEKYLREARLEEYRSHNSADVNECLDKVEKALLNPVACGPDYVKCLDYSGVYVNMTTGEPIYSARLFGLNELIVLDGTSADVLKQNPEFNTFLDSKRVYAKTALDSCRDLAEVVWSEFKRNALIKISQAQDEKIEDIKMSCVSTMKECYDTQSGALKSFDDTTAQASGGLAARAARDMCSDKVLACAALYGDPTKCEVDIKTNKVTDKGGCGLNSLLNFVSAVDDTRIAEGCGAGVKGYLERLCTPTAGEEGYPWNCRLRQFGTTAEIENINEWTYSQKPESVAQMVINYAFENCGERTGSTYKLDEIRTKQEVSQELISAKGDLEYILEAQCTAMDGYWNGAEVSVSARDFSRAPLLKNFYNSVFGGETDSSKVQSLGTCYENTTMTKCLGYNTDGEKDGDMARYDADKDECVFTDKWYEQQCALLGNGYFENGVCYVAQ